MLALSKDIDEYDSFWGKTLCQMALLAMQTNKGGVANPFVSHPLLCVIVMDESLVWSSDII